MSFFGIPIRNALSIGLGGVASLLSGPGEPVLLFDDPLQSTVVPTKARGSATATFTLATTRTVEDFEGLVRPILSGEWTSKGSRIVQNLIPTSSSSEDMTDGAYLTANGASVTATQATFDGTANGEVSQDISITDDGSGAAGRTFVYSTSIRLISGSISADNAIQIAFEGNALTNASVDIGSEITSTSQPFAVTASTDAAGTVITPKVICDDALVLEITEWMPEEVTGQAITTPSEYVSVGVLAAPYHGLSVDGKKAFITANGNTVSGGVVTRVTGAAFDATDFFNDTDGPFGSLAGGQRINICLQSEDLDTSWNKDNSDVNINAAVAPDGKTTADRIIDDSGGGTNAVRVDQNITFVNSTAYTWSVYAKADQLDWVWVYADIGVGVANCYFDLTNGVVGTAVNTDSTNIQALPNNWYRCSITFTTDGTAGNVRIYVAEADEDFVVARDGTSSIFAWGTQVEAGTFPSSYIPTTTGTVTRNIGVLSYPAAGNLWAPSGTISFEWTPDVASQGEVFLFGSFLDASNCLSILHDGSNIILRKRVAGTMYNATKALAYVAGTVYTIAGEWDDTGAQIYVDDVAGTAETTSIRAVIGTDFEIGTNGNGEDSHYGAIREFKIYNRDL